MPIKNPSGNHLIQYWSTSVNSKQVHWDPPVVLVCTGPVEQSGLGHSPQLSIQFHDVNHTSRNHYSSNSRIFDDEKPKMYHTIVLPVLCSTFAILASTSSSIRISTHHESRFFQRDSHVLFGRHCDSEAVLRYNYELVVVNSIAYHIHQSLLEFHLSQNLANIISTRLGRRIWI